MEWAAGKSRAGAEVDVVAQGGSTWIEVKCYESVDLRSASWTGGATRKGEHHLHLTKPHEGSIMRPVGLASSGEHQLQLSR